VRALLDTHTFLWWNLDDPQLSATAREFIAKGSNEIFLSAASAWEIAIKAAKGRLSLPASPDQYVADRLRLHRFSTLSIELSHALHVYQLPAIHQDPFDRVLIAQSLLEDLPILSGDPEIGRYEVEVIW
jgi:PIN domain nuclease of toxin-antitoxin system